MKHRFQIALKNAVTLAIIPLVILLITSIKSCLLKNESQFGNICAIFYQHPDWHSASKNVQDTWGIPSSVQMAILKQESSFNATARPPLFQLFGIPIGRKTSAYGYAQALNETWNDYRKETRQVNAVRTSFNDAANFLGWYLHKIHHTLNINTNNAYALYLAYHEGIRGYEKSSFKHEKWLTRVADKVQHNANIYHKQLIKCQNKMEQPTIWNRWMWV